MAGPGNIDSLNQQIRERLPSALDKLAALPSPCVVDASGQSPFNVAIEANNAEAVSLLLEVDEAREFAPDIHTKDDVRLMKTIYRSDEIDDIELAERRILDVVHAPPYWQRTPLLQACRYQNRDAIRELIAGGAKLSAKDLLGETPLSLCVASGGLDLAGHFIESCVGAKTPFPLSEDVLWAICGNQELYKPAVTRGRPNPAAKRFIFNLACATLDRSTIEEMLDQGFDVNSAIPGSTNPVVELVSSRLAWLYKASGWEEFAAGYAHMNGHPDTTSIQISNNPGPGDLTFGQTKALHAKLNESLHRKEINPKFMSAESTHERLALLSLLIEKGLDVGKAKKNLDFPITADVITSNEPEFVAALITAGFGLASDGGYYLAQAILHGCFDMAAALEKCGHKLKKRSAVPDDMLEQYRQWHTSNKTALPAAIKPQPASTKRKKPELSWELGGESVLFAETDPDPPRAGEPCAFRLRHWNVYGPCADVRFEMQTGEGTWRPFELIGEMVYVDDEDTDLADLDEPPIGETPWTGIFESKATLPKGKQNIVIRVTTPDADNCGTLDDWLVDVADGGSIKPT